MAECNIENRKVVQLFDDTKSVIKQHDNEGRLKTFFSRRQKTFVWYKSEQMSRHHDIKNFSVKMKIVVQKWQIPPIVNHIRIAIYHIVQPYL